MIKPNLRRPGFAAVLATALASIPAAALAEGTTPDAGPTPGAPSNAAVASQLATVLIPVVARTSPAVKARKTTDVSPVTRYSQEPTTLLVRNMKVETNGRVSWVQVQLPGRPNGRMGWIPRSAVLLDQTNSRIKVRLKSRVVETYTAGKLTGTYKAAVGTGGTPTPTGNFAIDDPYRTKTASERGTYGPYILTLNAYSNVLKTFGGGPGTVAIHGWPDASVLGKAVSHGCIRVSNSSVAAIARIAKSGTPVDIVDD